MDNWLALAVAILAVAAACGAAFAVLRAQGIKTNVDLMATANTEMRGEIAYLHDQRIQEKEQCAKDIGKLQGRIDSLENQHLTTFLTELRLGVQEMLREELRSKLPSMPPETSI